MLPYDAIIVTIILLISSVHANEISLPNRSLELNTTSILSSSSPWLKKVKNRGLPRYPGCWSQPWICRERERPYVTRMRCCRNQCVDVWSDVNHCGLCGIRCPFTWQCCRGRCIDTNISPWNCGKCGNRCPWGVHCVYGMCGYAQPLPPWPRPRPRPRPPFPCPPSGPPHLSHSPHPLNINNMPQSS